MVDLYAGKWREEYKLINNDQAMTVSFNINGNRIVAGTYNGNILTFNYKNLNNQTDEIYNIVQAHDRSILKCLLTSNTSKE